MNDFELHPDRLSTTDASGKRIFVHPADVRGFFRRQRTRVEVILILFFLLLPWLKIQGRQALLLDITERRFEIFGLSLRAHNSPLLILVFAAAAFGLFFATTLFGRIWCGWGCPQTVFIDGVFRRIERWIEGSALERRKLDKAPISFEKLRKRTIKWVLYIGATLVITHSFLAYFIGTDHLSQMIQQPPSENWGAFLFMVISSLIILFDFAWFREQFCTIVCPYGRFQSVLMDKGSLIVAYDVKRGEPRATAQNKAAAKAHAQSQNGNFKDSLGDCVNCYRCVQVCPTGIDIRRGLQMECIACTACIDACDEVMSKIHKPQGLIRYDNLASNIQATTPAKLTKPQKKMTFRASLYLTLCLVSIAALVGLLLLIKPIDIEIFRAKDSPYTTQILENKSVMVSNHFKLELSNQSGSTHHIIFAIASSFAGQDLQLITAVQPLPLVDGEIAHTDVFIRFPKTLLSNGLKKIKVLIQSKNITTGQVLELEREVTLVGPYS